LSIHGAEHVALKIETGKTVDTERAKPHWDQASIAFHFEFMR
jgi:hypothetical protein